MKAEQSKVLIGAPTASFYEYCLPDWATRVKELTYKNKTAVLVDNSESIPYNKIIEKYDIKAIKYPEFIKDSRERLAASRNILRKMVLDEGYDYFLSLEQDVIPPVNVIEQLLRHNQKIVTGVYYKYFDLRYTYKNKEIKKVKKLMPLLFGFIPGIRSKMHFFSAEEVEGDKILPVRFCGLGCVIMHRDVLEKIKFRADTSVVCHDDLWFCNDALANKFPIYADTSVKCKHMLSGKPSGVFSDIKKTFTPKEDL